jgi:hypothetical protein
MAALGRIFELEGIAWEHPRNMSCADIGAWVQEAGGDMQVAVEAAHSYAAFGFLEAVADSF